MQLGGITPAEKAGVYLELGRNKFLELIKKQALKKHHSLRWQCFELVKFKYRYY